MREEAPGHVVRTQDLLSACATHTRKYPAEPQRHYDKDPANRGERVPEKSPGIPDSRSTTDFSPDASVRQAVH